MGNNKLPKNELISDKSEEVVVFGAQKIAWILAKTKKVFVIAKDETTKVYSWQEEGVEL